MKGILLDNDFELVAIGGGLPIGNTTMQEVGIIMGMNQGELKSDPILGPNLTRMMRSNRNRSRLQQAVRTHLERDRKDNDVILEYLRINIGT